MPVCSFLPVFWLYIKKEERLQEIDFTVVDDDEIPEELKTIIDQKKTGEFKLTYADQDELYIVVGYGKQLTGGYSIQFPDVYLTKENIVVTSVLLGRRKNLRISVIHTRSLKSNIGQSQYCSSKL